MKALSIRQPWAFMIVRPDLVGTVERASAFAAGEIKDIENRTWPTNFRGRVLIHASKGMTRDEWDDAWYFYANIFDSPETEFMKRLTFHNIERGGIVGSVEIVDCVTRYDSSWFMGIYGFVLRNPIVLPFRPCRGALGFFDVPDVLQEPKEGT